MKPIEILKMFSESMNPNARTGGFPSKLAAGGATYSFSERFTDRVIDRIFNETVINRQIEFVRSLNNVFYRVAFAGVAAIAVLLLSIFLMEGSLTFNSLVGISESFDENLISLLTGN
jgi:hypothetical protein